MKKIFSVVAILLCFATSYGQEIKASPTKQETMDWIAGKMKICIVNDQQNKYPTYSFISYENGIILFSRNRYFGCKERNGTQNCKIDLNKITALGKDPKNTEDSLQFIMGSGVKLIEAVFDGNIETSECGGGFQDAITAIPNGSYSMFNFKQIPNLEGRMLKALNVLIAFNTGTGGTEKF